MQEELPKSALSFDGCDNRIGCKTYNVNRNAWHIKLCTTQLYFVHIWFACMHLHVPP